MKPIYEPKGKAREYADLAINIFTGCPNGCEYCFAPAVLRKTPEQFSQGVIRHGILEATVRQLEGGGFEGRTIHLCFTCDPYPSGMPTMVTREVIEAIHEAGAFVQILTKNPVSAMRDFDLLGERDMFGVTYTGAPLEAEPNSDSASTRLEVLRVAHENGFGTWVSCEPVYDPEAIFRLIEEGDYIDVLKIGKLNHRKSAIDWAAFGREAERLCLAHGREYVIKDSLREEMEKADER